MNERKWIKSTDDLPKHNEIVEIMRLSIFEDVPVIYMVKYNRESGWGLSGVYFWRHVEEDTLRAFDFIEYKLMVLKNER